MKIKEIFDRILYYASVPKCVCCEEALKFEDKGLCEGCATKYRYIKKRQCSRCFKTYESCTCVNDNLEKAGIKSLTKCFRYLFSEEKQPSNYLIYSLKNDNRKDVIALLTKEVSDSIRTGIKNYSSFIITNVPRRMSSKIKRGFDHAEQLARSVAKELSIEYRPMIVSLAKKDQKKLTKTERATNPDLRAIKGAQLNGESVIIFDDVVTTGSSMIKSRRILKELGAGKVVGACIGVAFRDKYTPFKIPESDYVYW